MIFVYAVRIPLGKTRFMARFCDVGAIRREVKKFFQRTFGLVPITGLMDERRGSGPLAGIPRNWLTEDRHIVGIRWIPDDSSPGLGRDNSPCSQLLKYRHFTHADNSRPRDKYGNSAALQSH